MKLDSEKINISLNSLAVGDDHPVRVMGVLNISPESFYPGSVVAVDDVAELAGDMIENGAEMLDIGGRSTAPRARSIGIEEEMKRVTGALEKLFSSLDTGTILISVDTQFKTVAESAFKIFIKYGKEDFFLLNDVSNLHSDPGLAPWISGLDKPLVLMASHQKPGDSLGIGQTISDLTESMDILEAGGFNTKEKVIIDPGVGRWVPEKTPAYDLELIGELEQLRCLKRPILVGISRKSFIGAVLNSQDAAHRFPGTLSATAIAVYNGAHVIRTHDVNRATMDVIRVASAIRDRCLLTRPK